ncbi:DUF4129 domain-containing protein [Paenibacillus sp. sgz302251]|uniref:DUF4129 domain-containing protein n=1 Tax=Paenibacillus sp. sgz302251 TaxID=3414493 RepID=UPI003C7D390D
MRPSMKQSHPLAALGQGTIELFFYLPVLLIAAVYLLPVSVIWWWIATLPLCYWLASETVKRLPKLRRIVTFFVAAAIGAVHAYLCINLWGAELQAIAFLVFAFIGGITASRGMSSIQRGWAESFPNSLLLIGVMTYVAAQPLKLFLFKKLVDYNGVLIICGITSMILLFFFANERHVSHETIYSAKTPATLAYKRQNRFLMLIIVSSIVILALFKQIHQAVESFLRSLMEKLMSWLNRPQKEQPNEELPIAQPLPEMIGGEEVKPPADWVLLLEQILKYVGISFIIFGAAILLFILLRKLNMLVKRIAAKLMERGAENRKNEADFTDEEENLMSLSSLRKQMGGRLQNLLPKKRGQDWHDLNTNAEKIRFLYAWLVHSDRMNASVYQAHLTPQETAERLKEWRDEGQRDGLQHFIKAYEQVRYGEKMIKDEQVAAFKAELYKENK